MPELVQRLMSAREIKQWYTHLPEDDQREVSKAVQKWHDKNLGIPLLKGKKDG